MHPHENSIKPIRENLHKHTSGKENEKKIRNVEHYCNWCSIHCIRCSPQHTAHHQWNANYSYKYKMNANTNLRLEITTVKQTMANTTAVILPLKRTSSNRWMKRLHSHLLCITWVSLCVWRPHTTIKPSEWYFFVLSNFQCCIFASHHIISIVENEWIVDTFYRRKLNATCIIQ